MNKVSRTWSRIGAHKYLLVTLVFLVIMVFLDENNWIRYSRNVYEINRLKQEIKYYRQMYERDTERLNDLSTNPEAIEKIAREKYLMKKPDEDIYIFEE